MNADASDFADLQKKCAGFAVAFPDDIDGKLNRLAEEIVE